jgi:hypothetical protein
MLGGTTCVHVAVLGYGARIDRTAAVRHAQNCSDYATNREHVVHGALMH